MKLSDVLNCKKCKHNMGRSRCKFVDYSHYTVRCNKCKTVHDVVLTFPKKVPAPKSQWCIVVGKPNMKAWTAQHHPDMNNVGRVCTLSFFNTRNEARREAKVLHKSNPSWFYHAKKVEAGK